MRTVALLCLFAFAMSVSFLHEEEFPVYSADSMGEVKELRNLVTLYPICVPTSTSTTKSNATWTGKTAGK
ncbi:MAG: hypothetical protein MJ252_17235 [archaeon]|nr:hypothetical protein [archaeon]